MKNFSRFGLSVPKILLPRKDIPLAQWAVVACDQYTQDREYWDKVRDVVAGKPSALSLILPEVYLGDEDKSQRIDSIRQSMRDYLAEDVFRPEFSGFVYLERTTEYGRVRKGLMAAVDLESYQWKPFSKALIRATEATIPDRIPPRMEIRRGAALELPHIMLLVNDKAGLLVESCGRAVVAKGEPLYQGDLMLGAGHIVGYPVEEEVLAGCYDALEQLAVENTSAEDDTFLFAVGDGNHSLATAKAVWDEYKAGQLAAGKKLADLADCSLRYALVEIVNIYDSGLTFEPIHRVVFGCDAAALMDYCRDKLEGQLVDVESYEKLASVVADSTNSFGFVFVDGAGKQQFRRLKTSITELAVSRLQPLLDEFLAERKSGDADYIHGTEIDYIHGTDEVFRLGSQPGAMAILLPPVAKDSFFSTIGSGGPLPRKSFSMGEASEKRFYLEARKI